MIKEKWLATILPAVILTVAFCLSLIMIAGCTSKPPDTSAPERIQVERSPDWRGALLYIADEQGPVANWGSIRIYDNTSGFVEMSIEQTLAAMPSDMYVTRDGSSMYVASSANGRIEKFRWDGNSWIHGLVIETPAEHIYALVPGPDGIIYMPASGPAAGPEGIIYQLDPATDHLAPNPISIPGLEATSGISWSTDSTTAYITGTTTIGSSTSNKAKLLITTWPSFKPKGEITLPGVTFTGEVITSPDGRFVYVMSRGKIFKVDPATKTITAILSPAGDPEADYYDADFSADGRYMFTAATPPGSSDSTLYVIDLANETVVKTVKHISIKAMGIQRVE